jgi:hypothetical protein
VGQSTDGLPLSLEAISCHPFPPEGDGCGLRLKLSMPHWSKRQQSELALGHVMPILHSASTFVFIC